MIHRSASPDDVLKAIMRADAHGRERSPKDVLRDATNAAHTARIAYKGGQRAVELLIRKPQETMQSWESRRQWFRNVPIVRQITDVLTQLVYGEPVDLMVWLGEKPRPTAELAEIEYQQIRFERGWTDVEPEPVEHDTDSDDLAAWLSETYENNDMQAVRMRVLPDRLLTGYGIGKVWPIRIPDSETQILRITCRPYGEAVPIPDPEDADTIIGVVERLARGAIRVWGGTGFTDYDDTGSRIAGTDPEAAEVWDMVGFPFAIMGDGCPHVADAILDQVVAINRDSTLNLAIRQNGFSLPVVTGQILNETTRDKASGEEGVAAGPNNMIRLAEGGSFSYANPNAPLNEHREGVKDAIQSSLKAHGLPEDYYTTSGGVAQPLAKMLSWMPTFLKRATLIGEASIWERDMAWLCSRYAAAMPQDFGLPEIDPEAVGVEVRFNPNPLPTDRAEQIRLDMEQVTGGTMTKIEYLSRRYPEWGPSQLAEYAARLEEQERNRFGGVMAEPFPMPTQEPGALPPIPEPEDVE